MSRTALAFSHFGIYVHELARMEGFYTKMPGFRPRAEWRAEMVRLMSARNS